MEKMVDFLDSCLQSFFNDFFQVFLFFLSSFNFYIPILLLDEEHFAKKIRFLAPFWKFGLSINLSEFSDPPYRGVTDIFFENKVLD